jgi:hypothetical protein
MSEKKIEITEKEFIEDSEKWFKYLNNNEDELIILTESGKKLVAMSEDRYKNVYEKFLPVEEKVTYEDFCSKK